MGKKIVDIDVLDVEKRRVPSKHYVYVILVKWSDGLSLTVFRRYSRFFDLQAQLLDLFPIEGGSIAPEKRIIPFLPGKIFFGRSHIKDVAVKRLDDIRAYCKSLIKLPSHISECEEVNEFFEVEPDDLDPPSLGPDEGKRKLSLSLSLNSLSKSKSSKEKKAEKISKPKRLDRYVAVAEYEVQAPGEMVLHPGLRVDVLEKSDSGWWFVNSEDEQGWVPSTYLEPESGEAVSVTPAAIAEPGQEENFICIEKFEGASADEVSLEKGAVVQVLQKNMDGWWLVRYMGREAYAPSTYLKKATNGHTHSLVEKSRLSGVEIITSLQDVSSLLNKDKKDDSPPTTKKSPERTSTAASALVKARSLERGGSLIPPPRQASVTKVEAPVTMRKTSVYVTIEDFEDTVGDGLSFRTGQQVYVKEKTATGWWFVELGGREGWVPASYLESCSQSQDTSSAAPSSDVFHDDDFSDEEWYDHPDLSEENSPLRMGENSHGYAEMAGDVDRGHVDMAKRPLPPIPPGEEIGRASPKQTPASESPRMAHRPLPSAPGPKDSGKAAPDNKESGKAASCKKGLAKPGPELPTPKKPTLTKNNDAMGPKVGAKPTEPRSGQDTAPKPVLPAGGMGGDQDLAAILKAKFAARSGSAVDSGNSSDDDMSKPAKQPPAKPKMQPIVPKKPSEIIKDTADSNQTPAFINEDKGFSKPPPPVKNKPLKPPVFSKPSGSNNAAPTPGAKPGFPGVQLKSVSKPSSAGSSDATAGNKSNCSNGPFVPAKGNVKAIGAAFANSSSQKPKPVADKPSVPGKPKPLTAAKPSVASKPHVVAQKPGSQNVNSLANNLSGKLNFGKRPVDSEAKQAPVRPPAPASKPASQPAATPEAPMSRSYVALFDFTAENDGEVSFNEGDDLEVMEEQGDWSLVRCWDEEGWAPTSYLQKV